MAAGERLRPCYSDLTLTAFLMIERPGASRDSREVCARPERLTDRRSDSRSELIMNSGRIGTNVEAVQDRMAALASFQCPP